jgi:hypothetical protein
MAFFIVTAVKTSNLTGKFQFVQGNSAADFPSKYVVIVLDEAERVCIKFYSQNTISENVFGLQFTLRHRHDTLTL